MADPICTINASPAHFFHSPEPWEHIPLPLQLTSKNLSDLGAVLASLRIRDQQSRVIAQTASDSSSDSDSNHRLHRSSKKVCVREDLNTIRDISPCRPKRPKPIDVPNVSASKAKWRKPDTPATWHILESNGLSSDGRSAQVPPKVRSHVGSPPLTAFHIRRLQAAPPSPLRSYKISIKRKRNEQTISPSAAIDPATSRSADPPRAVVRPKIRPTSLRLHTTRATPIRRLSQLATPRPRSLPMSPRSPCGTTAYLSIGSKVDLNDTKDRASSRDRCGSVTQKPGPSILVRSFAYDDLRTAVQEPASGTPSSWPPVEERSLLRSQPTEQIKPPRTYVDHVRSQRGIAIVQNSDQRKANVPIEAAMELTRRRSSF